MFWFELISQVDCYDRLESQIVIDLQFSANFQYFGKYSRVIVNVILYFVRL